MYGEYWSEDGLYYLLRHGRKHEGAWDEYGEIPDDGDLCYIMKLPALLWVWDNLDENTKKDMLERMPYPYRKQSAL